VYIYLFSCFQWLYRCLLYPVTLNAGPPYLCCHNNPKVSSSLFFVLIKLLTDRLHQYQLNKYIRVHYKGRDVSLLDSQILLFLRGYLCTITKRRLSLKIKEELSVPLCCSQNNYKFRIIYTATLSG